MPDFAPGGPCPVCRTPDMLQAPDGLGRGHHVKCGNCGQHIFSHSALATLRGNQLSPDQAAALAHGLCKIDPTVVVDSYMIESLEKSIKLPGAAECIDNLLLFFASRQRPGIAVEVLPVFIQATVGAVSKEAAAWVLEEAVAAGLVRNVNQSTLVPPDGRSTFLVTSQGWERHAKLLRDGAGSTHAFMAMDFNEADIRAFFGQHLQAAVAQTGFELRTTDHPGKTADLIDNRMRVDLRTSRFVVCDLTHGNRGAYWEAGFAEGIGRPVFYICRRDVRDSTDKDTRPHFDAAHQAIVAWDSTDPAAGLAELKDMIRATLPAEATMEDT